MRLGNQQMTVNLVFQHYSLPLPGTFTPLNKSGHLRDQTQSPLCCNYQDLCQLLCLSPHLNTFLHPLCLTLSTHPYITPPYTSCPLEVKVLKQQASTKAGFIYSLWRGGQGNWALSQRKCWLDTLQSSQNLACAHLLTCDPVTLSAQLHQFRTC